MSAIEQINKIVEYFKKEPYLKDKTDAMGDGLELGAKLADEANERSIGTKNDVVALQQEYTENGNGSQTTAEITLSRDGEDTLRDRLDRDHQNVTAQLAQTESELEQRGVNGVKLFDIETNGTTDVTAKVQQTYDYAANLGLDVWWQNGRYLVSAPIDTKGCSTYGQNRFRTTFLADPTVPHSRWIVGANPNDVGLFASLDKDNITFENIEVDGQDAYVAGITFMSGDNVKVINCYIHDCSNCGLQFYGANGTKYNNGSYRRPITKGVMTGNIVKRCRWNYVMDGEVYDSIIEGNISEDATNRHISVDPREASAKQNRRFTISNNIINGLYPIPQSWIDTPSVRITADYAIGFKEECQGVVTGNAISNWNAMGIGAIYLGGVVSGNIITDATIGIDVVSAKDGLTIQTNAIYGGETGLRIDSDTDRAFISNNTFDRQSVEAMDSENAGLNVLIKDNNVDGDLQEFRRFEYVSGQGRITKYSRKMEITHTLTLDYESAGSFRAEWNLPESFRDSNYQVFVNLRDVERDGLSGTLFSKMITGLRADAVDADKAVIRAFSVNDSFLEGDTIIVDVMAIGEHRIIQTW